MRRYALRDDQWEKIKDLLPGRFGDFRVVHTRFSRWNKKGVREKVFQTLREDTDDEYAMIDSTIVRAHQHSAGAKGGIKTKKL